MPVKGDRTVAICQDCGSALAVRVLPDGSIRPIGTGTTCSCGGETFEVADDDLTRGGDLVARALEEERTQPRP